MVEDVGKSGTELRKMRMKEFLYDSGHGMRMKSTVRKEEQQKMQPKAKKRKRKSDAEVSGETRAIKDKPASSQALVQPSTTPLAPTVTLDKNGKIIVNTSSLVYTPSVARPDLAGYTERGEDDAKITVCSFKKRSIRRRWTHEETKKFYRALRACGLDFSMMAGFFPKRSRMELKRKYKREEKEHSDLVKLALDLRCALPLEALDVRAADEGHQIEDAEAEAEEATGTQKRNRQKGGRGKEKGVSSKSSKPKRGASTKKKQKTTPSKRSKKANGTEKTATKSSEKSSESRAASSSRTIVTKRKSKPKAQAKPKATTAPSRSKQLQRRKPQPKPKPKPKSTRKPSSSAARSRKQNERSKTRSASVSQISKETDGSNNVAPRVPESIAATEVETSETSKPMPNTENGKQQADEEEKVNKTAEENDEEEEDDATGDSSDEEVSKLAQILTRGKSRAVEHDFEGSDED